MAKVRDSYIITGTILLWLGPDNIHCCPQLITLDSLEKVVDFSAIVHSNVAMISKSLHYGVMFLVKCDILVPIPSFPLTSIIRDLQLSFCFCFFCLPGHMVRAKILIVDVEQDSLTILHTLSLFHIYICVCIHEDL